MNQLYGLPVHTSPLLAEKELKIKLSHDVLVSDEFRARFNEWSLNMFGEERMMYVMDLSALGISGGRVVMGHPRNVAMLKAHGYN
jgi:hypothetical protein